MLPKQKVALKLAWAENELGRSHPKTTELKNRLQKIVEDQRELIGKLFSIKPNLKTAVVENPEKLEKTWVEVLSRKKDGIFGFLATDIQGKKLRKFIDTNGDKNIDVWIYFNGGVETYRDVDKNFDGKVDEILFVDGDLVRVGNDTDQDGKIDAWKERALPSNLDRWKPELHRRVPRR